MPLRRHRQGDCDGRERCQVVTGDEEDNSKPKTDPLGWDSLLVFNFDDLFFFVYDLTLLYWPGSFFSVFQTDLCCAGFQSPGDQRLPRSSVGSVVQKASLTLTERGRRLSRAEDKTVDLMYRAHQFADTAHKVRYTTVNKTLSSSLVLFGLLSSIDSYLIT